MADDFFRLVHDAYHGTLKVGVELARIGLAAALLGELLWTEKIIVELPPGGVRGQEVVLPWDPQPPQNALTHRILDTLRGEPESLTVRTWLDYLSLDALPQVTDRLLTANALERHKERAVLRNRIHLRPVDANHWDGPRIHISSYLHQKRPGLHSTWVYLAGLAKVTNVLDDVMTHYDGADWLDELLPTLPAAAQTLLAVTRAAVDERVLGTR